MNCAQRILYNGINAARTAALTASSVRPASNSIRTLPTARDGSAAVALSGAFTGANDAAFDVEIVDTTVSSPIVSQPQFVGVGNGALSAIAFTGTAQGFTLELVDAGAEEKSAAVAFAGCQIVARAAGAAGNGISIAVTPALTFTPLSFSLIAALPKDTRRSDAVGLDFNAAVMAADNLMPTTAKRIIFGDDQANIYRQAKQWMGDKWEYVFEPEIQRYCAVGERVSEVSGTYTVTVTQGMTTETLTGIKTAYDLLVQLNTLSALVRVDGVIANDRGQGGQAAGELRLRTAAHAQPVIGNGSATAQRGVLQSIVVNSGAATEVIELRCWAVSPDVSPNARLGHELWAVKGSVSGDIGNFATGDTIADPAGNWSVVVPQVFPDGYPGAHGSFTVEQINMPRSGATQPPQVCPVGLTLGPAAVDQSVTLVYTKRPSTECLCGDMPIPDFTANDCLFGPGNPNSPGASSVSYPGAITARMTSLWAWYRDYVKSYSGDNILSRKTIAGEPMSEQERIAAAREVAALLEKTAIQVAADSGALTMWDTAFADAQTHFQPPDAKTTNVTAAETIAANSFVRIVGARLFKATAYAISGGGGGGHRGVCHGFTSGAISSGASVTRSSVSFAADGVVTGLTGLTIGTSYSIDSATPGALVARNVDDAGFSADALSADAVRVYVDPRELALVEPFDVVVDRFKATRDAILAAAGISPLGKADATTVSDDGCWQDIETEAYYWAVVGSNGGGYMPAFNNVPYVSCRNVGGVIGSTREFAFQINVKCPDQLKVDDTIVLRIGNASWAPTYQVGDTLTLPIVAAAPLVTVGGQNGSLDQIWHVNGTVDGAFAVFTATAGSGSYSDGGLSFTLTAGGIRFAKGDRFAFSAEGGHWQWRKNGGGWVGPLAIGTGAVVLSDGVSATITPGAAPSFVPGDRYSFAVRQPNSPGNVQNPNEMAWRWVGATATLDIDLGSAQAFDSIALARHRLPATATINIQAGTSSGAADVLAATPIAWSAGTLALLLANAVTARYVRITLTGATDGALGWVYVGAAYQPSLAASLTGLRREYVMDRGGGVNPAARFVGSGSGGAIEWQEGGLVESDFTALVAMVDWLKSQGDEPLMFFYSTSRPGESLLARVNSDQVELRELMDYQPMAGVDRFFEASLGLSAVIA